MTRRNAAPCSKLQNRCRHSVSLMVILLQSMTTDVISGVAVEEVDGCTCKILWFMVKLFLSYKTHSLCDDNNNSDEDGVAPTGGIRQTAYTGSRLSGWKITGSVTNRWSAARSSDWIGTRKEWVVNEPWWGSCWHTTSSSYSEVLVGQVMVVNLWGSYCAPFDLIS